MSKYPVKPPENKYCSSCGSKMIVPSIAQGTGYFSSSTGEEFLEYHYICPKYRFWHLGLFGTHDRYSYPVEHEYGNMAGVMYSFLEKRSR